MSADGFTVVTLLFPDPQVYSFTQNSFLQLNQSVSYQFSSSDIQTLSTTNANPGNDLTGLLYVPELEPSSKCLQTLPQYVPANVTSNGNLPSNAQFAFLAIAPWISTQCTSDLLYAAKDDPLRAFIFYQPDNGTSIPPLNGDAWSMGDGGRWKSQAKFPVYAVPGSVGGNIVQNLALYSGNLTAVPHGQTLADEFSPTCCVRLAGSISIEGQNTLPSLWVFLLIVLGLLMFIIASTSCAMHCLQRRRRERLRRRVANGEVDLEQLGIKRLTVPRRILDDMPLYTYPVSEKQTTGTIASTSPTAPTTDAHSPRATSPPVDVPTDDETEKTSNVVIPPSPNNNNNTTEEPNARRRTVFAQPTCAICLEEFVPGQSTVRELPCHHIFHADCVDTFLRENSSLCPLCKKTSLPRGYCPPLITNAMVRRERMIRRMRERVSTAERDERQGVFGRFGRNRRRRRAGVAMSGGLGQDASGSVEMGGSAAGNDESSAGEACRVSNGVEGRSSERDAEAHVGPTVDEMLEDERRPRWRRIVGAVWPGLV